MIKSDIAWIEGQDGILRAGELIQMQTYPNPVAHPLGPPTVSTTTISVDTALNSPTRVTRTLMDLTLQRFFADRVFSNTGGVSGGAVIYDELLANDLYADRDIERVAPGDEFPLVTTSRRIPKVAEVEKWGGKFFMTVEARDRNDVSVFTRNVRLIANTIVRKINQRAVEVLEAAAQAAPNRVVTGVSWGASSRPDRQRRTRRCGPVTTSPRRNTDGTEELGQVLDSDQSGPPLRLGSDLRSRAQRSALLGLSIFATNQSRPRRLRRACQVGRCASSSRSTPSSGTSRGHSGTGRSRLFGLSCSSTTASRSSSSPD
jgi:hypothetical protein